MDKSGQFLQNSNIISRLNSLHQLYSWGLLLSSQASLYESVAHHPPLPDTVTKRRRQKSIEFDEYDNIISQFSGINIDDESIISRDNIFEGETNFSIILDSNSDDDSSSSCIQPESSIDLCMDSSFLLQNDMDANSSQNFDTFDEDDASIDSYTYDNEKLGKAIISYSPIRAPIKIKDNGDNSKGIVSAIKIFHTRIIIVQI